MVVWQLPVKGSNCQTEYCCLSVAEPAGHGRDPWAGGAPGLRVTVHCMQLVARLKVQCSGHDLFRSRSF